MTLGKNTKMIAFLNYRIRVVLQDSRHVIGTFKAFDKHMNLVLDNCDEFRYVKSRKTIDKEVKRPLGFVLLAGRSILSVTIEGPPPPEENTIRLPIPGASQSPAMTKTIPRPPGMGMPRGPPPPPGMMSGPRPPMRPPGGFPGYAGPPRGPGGYGPPQGFPPRGAPGGPAPPLPGGPPMRGGMMRGRPF